EPDPAIRVRTWSHMSTSRISHRRTAAAGSLALASAILLSWPPGTPVLASPNPAGTVAAARPPRGIAAHAGELANVHTGKQLWGRRQYAKRPIASITKVMTALVVVRSGHLD